MANPVHYSGPTRATNYAYAIKANGEVLKCSLISATTMSNFLPTTSSSASSTIAGIPAGALITGLAVKPGTYDAFVMYTNGSNYTIRKFDLVNPSAAASSSKYCNIAGSGLSLTHLEYDPNCGLNNNLATFIMLRTTALPTASTGAVVNIDRVSFPATATTATLATTPSNPLASPHPELFLRYPKGLSVVKQGGASSLIRILDHTYFQGPASGGAYINTRRFLSWEINNLNGQIQGPKAYFETSTYQHTIGSFYDYTNSRYAICNIGTKFLMYDGQGYSSLPILNAWVNNYPLTTNNDILDLAGD